MQDLNRALGDIKSIRQQMARTTKFRGCGPASLVVTALFAIMAAGAQTVLVRDPAGHIGSYLVIWVATRGFVGWLNGSTAGHFRRGQWASRLQ